MLMAGLEEAPATQRRTRREKEPLRRCIVCGESAPQPFLVRFVVAPDGTLVPDLPGTLPGRGIWVHASRRSLERAIAKKAFSRVARRPVEIAPDLVGRVEAALVGRIVERIGLARRAGQAVAGFEKVRAWLRQGRVALLLGAADGTAGGRGKLRALASEEVEVVACVLTARELGAAFARDHVVHAALAAGRLAAAVKAETTRLAGFRPDAGGWGER